MKYLSSLEGNRKIAVLGDILELGEYSKTLHKQVGEEVYKNNIDELIVVGTQAKFIADEAVKKGFKENNTKHFYNNDEVLNYLKSIIKGGDTVLFKASNAVKLFNVAENLKQYLES